MSNRKYAWKPDLPDQRDHTFKVMAPVARPSAIDLRPTMSPVEDQGQLGSCTGNATAGALEYLENKNKTAFFDVSRLWLYYQARVIEDTVKEDAGAMLRDVVKAAATVGYCTEKKWPYNVAKFAKKPTVTATKDAAKRMIAEYMRCVTLDNCLDSLALGFPVVFGFSVYESFESAEVAKTGVVPMPAKTEALLGGHAVLMVGYNDAEQRIIVRNSWGTGWGQQGYFTMPYGYIIDRNLSDDFWSIRK